ncbi:MAG TPA: hypothetical protein VGC59_15885 [Solirubrobacteraceae bacterium]|jgi:phage shock protein A
MGDNLAGIEEDVVFDWAGAQRLAAELRSAASTLSSQVSSRNGYAHGALEDWRGVFAREFVGRMQTCAGDAGSLSSAMEVAAHQVDELARLAREEQQRREAARAWKRQHDSRSILEKVGDFLTGDEEQPPIPPPVQPPHWTAESHVPGGRS